MGGVARPKLVPRPHPPVECPQHRISHKPPRNHCATPPHWTPIHWRQFAHARESSHPRGGAVRGPALRAAIVAPRPTDKAWEGASWSIRRGSE